MTLRADQAAAAADHGWASADWLALGTTAQVVTTDPSAMPAARAAVESVIERIDLAASRFREDSQISRLNTADGAWTDVSPLLARALLVALDAAQWTGGLVDPTMGAQLAHLGYDRTFRLVPADGPAVVLPVRVSTPITWRDVEVDVAAGRARVPAGTVVDLGATAKGLASDLAADDAAAAGGCGVLVSLGGDIAVAGPAPDDGWPVLVGDLSDRDAPPAYDDSPSQTIGLQTGGLATSSISARRWRRGGSQIHHILDPRTGSPAAGPWRTVSVTAQTCARANTASTASVVAGADAVPWLRSGGFAARLVDIDGHVTVIGGWPAATESALTGSDRR